MQHYEVFPDSTLDETFETLCDTHRRRVLLELADREDGDRDQHVVDALVPEPTKDDVRDRLKVVLYHVHLPKLDERDYIEWNRSEMTIRRGPNFSEIEPLLGLLDDHEHVLPETWP